MEQGLPRTNDSYPSLLRVRGVEQPSVSTPTLSGGGAEGPLLCQRTFAHGTAALSDGDILVSPHFACAIIKGLVWPPEGYSNTH